MKAKQAPPDHMLSEGDGRVEKNYVDWKRAKIERGLAQSKDRSAMISADQIWRELGLES